MNVALPAIVLLVLLLPGLIFRSALKRAEKIPLDYSPFGQVIAEGVLTAAALHALWLSIAHFALQLDFQLQLLLGLVSPNATQNAAAIAELGGRGRMLAQYFGSLYLASYLIPRAVRWLISKGRLDRHDCWLSVVARFHQAPWYYLLTGADFAKDELPDFIRVAAVVDVAGEAVLYRGVLEEWFVNQDDGTLDRLVISSAERRKFDKDKSDGTASGSEERFYIIDGDYFVIRYADIVTLNVQYVRITEAAESEPPRA